MGGNLKIGDTAPEIALLDGQGKEVRLSDFRGKKIIVLYFYPKDGTPGCTKEACSFRDSYSRYRALGAEVIGVSLDSVGSHKKFAGKYNLPFTLLSDRNKTAATAYGVLGPGGIYGYESYIHH